LAHAVVCALWLSLAGGGCSTVIGLTGYSTRADDDDGSVGDRAPAHAEASAPDADLGVGDGAAGNTASDASVEASCSGDDGACYACTPATTPQFLNACTGATCVPFDDVGRLTHLLPDGSLPPLPAPVTDAGGD
jgi:hypothetical protein